MHRRAPVSIVLVAFGFWSLSLDACGSNPNDAATAANAPIRGGTEALVNGVPWQARLLLPDALCGGALVGASWVLTAGHCVVGSEAASISVVLGDHSLTASETTEQWRQASEIVLFPGWGADTGLVVDNDLALIRLDEPADLGISVETVAVANSAGTCSAWVTGWGDTSRQHRESDVLQEAQVSIASSQLCREHLASLDERALSPRITCAGEPDGSIGTCHGDSGAPLVVKTPAGPKLVGIAISGGPDCGEFSLFANLAAYTDWLGGYLNQ